jgi:hypothetical protein
MFANRATVSESALLCPFMLQSFRGKEFTLQMQANMWNDTAELMRKYAISRSADKEIE